MKAVTLATSAFLLAATTAHAADPTNGKRIYDANCAVCHGVGGHPVLPGAPNFAKGDTLMQPDFALSATVQQGKNVMPGFLGILRDQEIRDVIAYLRTLHR